MSRVLVLDPWERAALASCRTLGRAGFEVGAAGHRASDLAATSRYTWRYDRLPDAAGPADRFEAALHALVAEHDYKVIVPSHDGTLARLASITLPVPSISGMGEPRRLLVDKVELGRLCERVGVPYPRTERILRPDDIEPALGRLLLPAFVKAESSGYVGADAVGYEKGATYAPDAATCLDAMRRLQAAGLPAIIQQRIPGRRKINVVLLRVGGTTLLRYAHHVLREVPRTGGMGIALQTLDPHTGDAAEGLDILERVCEAAGYEGIVQAELYRSAADDRLYLIDVNPRLWGSTWFVERLGLRVVERSVRAVAGLPPLPPMEYPVGRRFHVVGGELQWLGEHPDKRRAVGELLRSVRPRDTFEYIDATDPGPLVRRIGSSLARRSGDAAGRLRRR